MINLHWLKLQVDSLSDDTFPEVATKLDSSRYRDGRIITADDNIVMLKRSAKIVNPSLFAPVLHASKISQA